MCCETDSFYSRSFLSARGENRLKSLDQEVEGVKILETRRHEKSSRTCLEKGQSKQPLDNDPIQRRWPMHESSLNFNQISNRDRFFLSINLKYGTQCVLLSSFWEIMTYGERVTLDPKGFFQAARLATMGKRWQTCPSRRTH